MNSLAINSLLFILCFYQYIFGIVFRKMVSQKNKENVFFPGYYQISVNKNAILHSPYQLMRASVFLVASIVYSVKVLIFFLNLIGEKYFFSQPVFLLLRVWFSILYMFMGHCIFLLVKGLLVSLTHFSIKWLAFFSSGALNLLGVLNLCLWYKVQI